MYRLSLPEGTSRATTGDDVSYCPDNSASVNWGNSFGGKKAYEVFAEQLPSGTKRHYWGSSYAYSTYQSPGAQCGTNPCVLHAYKDAVKKPVMVMMTDGEIYDSAVQEFHRLMGDVFGEANASIAVIAAKANSPQNINCSVIATMLAMNPRCRILAADPKGVMREITEAPPTWEEAPRCNVADCIPKAVYSVKMPTLPEGHVNMGVDNGELLVFNEQEATVADLTDAVLLRYRMDGRLDVLRNIVRKSRATEEMNEATRGAREQLDTAHKQMLSEDPEERAAGRAAVRAAKDAVAAIRAANREQLDLVDRWSRAIATAEQGSWTLDAMKLGSNRARRAEKIPEEHRDLGDGYRDRTVRMDECPCCCSENAPLAIMFRTLNAEETTSLTSNAALDVPLCFDFDGRSRYEVCVDCAPLFVDTGLDAYRVPVSDWSPVFNGDATKDDYRALVARVCGAWMDGKMGTHLALILAAGRQDVYPDFVRGILARAKIRLVHETERTWWHEACRTFVREPGAYKYPPGVIEFVMRWGNEENSNAAKAMILMSRKYHTVSTWVRRMCAAGNAKDQERLYMRTIAAYLHCAYGTEYKRGGCNGDVSLDRVYEAADMRPLDIGAASEHHIMWRRIFALGARAHQDGFAEYWEKWMAADPCDETLLLGAESDFSVEKPFVPFVLYLGADSCPSVIRCAETGRSFLPDGILQRITEQVVDRVRRNRAAVFREVYGGDVPKKGTSSYLLHKTIAKIATEHPEWDEDTVSDATMRALVEGSVGGVRGDVYEDTVRDTVRLTVGSFFDMRSKQKDRSHEDPTVNRSLRYKISVETGRPM